MRSNKSERYGTWAGGAVQEIKSESQWENVLKEANDTGSRFVAEFTAVWCPPCRTIAPIVEEEAGKNPNVKFYKLDTENMQLQHVVSNHAVCSVPTFISYVAGKQIAAFSGADKNAFMRMVEDLSVQKS